MAPAPYRLASFKALARRADLLTKFVFVHERTGRHAWQDMRAKMDFPFSILPQGRWKRFSEVVRGLSQGGPDLLVLGGWNQFEYWLAAAVSRISGRRYIVWSESTGDDWRRA